MARLAQLAERKALNLVVVGSSPTVGALLVGTDYPFYPVRLFQPVTHFTRTS